MMGIDDSILNMLCVCSNLITFKKATLLMCNFTFHKPIFFILFMYLAVPGLSCGLWNL